jgi:hypothetical protein
MLPLCSYYATKSSDTKQSAELTEIEQKFERIKLKNKRKEELLVAIGWDSVNIKH